MSIVFNKELGLTLKGTIDDPFHNFIRINILVFTIFVHKPFKFINFMAQRIDINEKLYKILDDRIIEYLNKINLKYTVHPHK
jgi:hypothetical protein